MKFKNIKNAQWANAEQTIIDCEVDIEINGVWETVPFTATANDIEKHGRKIYAEAIKGNVADYVSDLNAIKQSRIQELKQLLRDTDYVALSDYDQEKPDVIEQRAKWRAEIRTLEND